MDTGKTTALATQNNGYMKLADFNMSDIIAEELSGLDTGFERIKIPSAGSTMFEVPGDNPNEPDSVKDFSAVILFHHPIHAYYRSKFSGGSAPPDCGSFDGITGEGIPGGECASCPLNKFGTGENNAKACKNRRRIYLLREGEIFPLLLSLPTGSLKEFSRYIKRLLSKGKRSNEVVTRFSLKKAVNNNGIAYSQGQFSVGRALTAEEHAEIEKFSEQIKAVSLQVRFDYDNLPFDDENSMNIDPETGEILD